MISTKGISLLSVGAGAESQRLRSMRFPPRLLPLAFTAVFLELDTPRGILMKKEIYRLREIFRNVEYIVGCLTNLPEKKNYMVVKLRQ